MRNFFRVVICCGTKTSVNTRQVGLPDHGDSSHSLSFYKQPPKPEVKIYTVEHLEEARFCITRATVPWVVNEVLEDFEAHKLRREIRLPPLRGRECTLLIPSTPEEKHVARAVLVGDDSLVEILAGDEGQEEEVRPTRTTVPERILKMMQIPAVMARLDAIGIEEERLRRMNETFRMDYEQKVLPPIRSIPLLHPSTDGESTTIEARCHETLTETGGEKMLDWSPECDQGLRDVGRRRLPRGRNTSLVNRLPTVLWRS